jgi:hypothetical protein
MSRKECGRSIRRIEGAAQAHFTSSLHGVESKQFLIERTPENEIHDQG